MSPQAVMWIRDGVLVNRMHINPVAFAFSYWVFTAPERRRSTTIEALINYGFAKSGFSCAEKMCLFNNDYGDALQDIDAAASFYNVLATEAAKACDYFDGTVSLLRDLHAAGLLNFITSAVDQPVLDLWTTGEQGGLLAPYLSEILGRRQGFLKGPDHFEHVARRTNGESIYYVADAVSEIASARAHSSKYNIVPIGFAYEISTQQVMSAMVSVLKALETFIATGSCNIPYPGIDHTIDPALLTLPNRREVEESLLSAGAETLATGSSVTIVQNLRRIFEKQSSLRYAISDAPNVFNQ